MTADEWLEGYAGRLGVDPPDRETIDALLRLAGVAAHTSERWAAPVSCWLAAVAGVAPADALVAAEALAADDGGGAGASGT